MSEKGFTEKRNQMNPKTQKLIDEIQLERERIELDTAKARLDQIRLDNDLTQRRIDCEYPLKKMKGESSSMRKV